MSEPMKLKYTPEQFQKLLNQFQRAIDSGEYTEKIPYETWRKLKKLYHPKIEYASPFVKIYEVIPNIDGVDRDVIMFSAKIYDWGFGRFFYDYVVKKENDRMANSNTSSNITGDNMKMNLNDGALYIKADNSDWNTIGTATNVTVNTTDAVWGYGYSDRTTTSDRTTGYPSNLGTISTITTLSDRVNWLENEIQKKADKVEKDECVKENDTMMKGINFDFGPCGNTVRLSMYGMAIQNISGEWVSYNPDSHEIINVDVFNMADGGKYMYKMPVAIADIKVGDIVIHNRVPMFVTATNENGTFEVTDVRAGETKNIIPTRNMFGFNFMTKVVSLFGAFTDAPTADQPFGNMLPFLMMGENKDIDPMMMFFMMGQGGANAMANPMMMYFMMKDNKDFDPMMLMFMMNQTQPHTCNCGKHVEKPVTQA
jgi:hypothetical protein